MPFALTNRINRARPTIITQVLKGLGQIMLQENAVTGLLFLIGIFYGSGTMGLAALVATIFGTMTARLLKYPTTEINQGLYGFSAALTGVALILFLKPVLIVWIFIIAGSALAAIIQHFFIKRKIPVFTLPFVLVTWLILFLSKYYSLPFASQEPSTLTGAIDHFTFAIRGFGQVIFQGSLISGAIFFTAVFVNTPIAALYGLAGGLLSGIGAWYFSTPVPDINAGLLSFNAVLCSIAFAGGRTKDGLWVIVSVLLSLVISLIMLRYNLIQLTFPFVAASSMTLGIRNLIVRFKRQLEKG